MAAADPLTEARRAQRAAERHWPVAHWHLYEEFENAFFAECEIVADMATIGSPLAASLEQLRRSARARREAAAVNVFALIGALPQ
jgi:hypothetical protein